MKHLLLLCLTLFSLSACQNTVNKAKQSADTGTTITDADQEAITTVIHNFYQWYNDSINSLQVEYINYGKHLSLNMAKVDSYFEPFLKTGFISKEYVEGEKDYLKALEADWKKTEYEEGIIDGLDYDRFFCAQDWDIKFWTTAPVTVESLGTNRVKATLTGDEGGGERSQNLVLKKENGKWLITNIDCGE